MKVVFATDGKGNNIPFDLTYCTLSTARNTGGDIKSMKKVVLTGSTVNLKRNRMLNLVPLKQKGKGNRYERHVHLCLILSINGQQVT